MQHTTYKKLKILFVTRKFPPAIGGMENVAAKLYAELSSRADVTLIAIRGKKGGKNIMLPLAYVLLFLRAVWNGQKIKPDVIYIQDGVMASLGRALGKLLNRPVVVTIHGTEMVYQNKIYRRLVFPSLAKVQQAVAISDGTAEKVKENLPQLPVTKIVWGSDDDFYIDEPKTVLRGLLAEKIGLAIINDRPLLYHSGRLIERKGALWLVENVMPKVIAQIPNVLLLIGGDGEDADKIKQAITRLSLQDNVYMLGYVLGETRNLLFNTADLFIMPNIPGYGFEGFGMVAVEASSCGTAVVASSFEGITDAVIENQTGWLLPFGDSEAFVKKIISEISDPSLQRDEIRHKTLQKFDWAKTADEYLRVFQTIIKS